MKQNLLKTCLVMLFAVLGFGMSWAVEVSATLAAGTNGSAAKVGDKDAIKVGTSKAGGNMTITVPANAVSLTFYAAAWTGVSDLSLNITPAASVGTTSIALTADTGVTGNSPFTLIGEEDNYKHTITLNNINTETTLTLASSAAKRFVVWGATCNVQSNTAYTVTFNAGGNGTCSTTSLTEASAGAGVTLPAVTANDGYDFQGWSTSDTPSSADAGAAGETYNPTADITLYAYYTVARPANEVFYESFDTNAGTGGNDDQWKGSIASNTIKQDNEGWVYENGSGANKCAKFGAGSKLGSATTPAIAASGNLTLSFKAAAWDSNSESTTLKLSATGATLSKSTVTLTKSAWETYNVDITNATEGFKIKFEGNAASNSRFFLDEVSILTSGPAPTKGTIELGAVTNNLFGTDFGGYDFYYGTFSCDKDVIVEIDEDYNLWNVSPLGVNEGILTTAAPEVSTAVVTDETAEVVNGYYVPANTGVLVVSLAPTATYYYVAEDSENELSNIDEDGINLLRPASTPMTGEYSFYKLAYDDFDNKTGLGFYWGAENGGAFTCKPGTAYLAVPAESASNVRGFAFGGGCTTGIKSIGAAQANTEIFNLQGQRVSCLQQGVNIVNGKKVIR